MITPDTLPWTLAAAATGAALGAFGGLASLTLPNDESVSLAVARRPGAPVRLAAMTLMGAAAGAWAGVVHPGPLSVITAILGAWLLLLAVLDAEHFWLPLNLTAPLIGLGFIVTGLIDQSVIPAHLIGAGAGFAAFWLIAFAYRRVRRHDGLGEGDAWLAAACGAWVGWANLPTVVLIAAGTALVWVLALLIRRRLTKDRPIPFGLFLAIGLWLEWLYAV